MEQQLNKKFEEYIIKFKQSIQSKLTEVGGITPATINEIMEYIYDYDRLIYTKDDTKQKKTKEDKPPFEKCIAILPNGTQCNRKKKKNLQYCGGHLDLNGLNNNSPEQEEFRQIDVYSENVGGIIYYVDKYYNVYNTEDVMNNKQNPEVIAKYCPLEKKVILPPQI